MTVIVMSRKALSGLQVADRRLAVEDAASLMGVTRRQAYRLLDVFQRDGADGLVSKRRGRPSSRAHGAVLRETVLSIIRDRYRDFGPTLVAEKPREQTGVPVGVETLRSPGPLALPSPCHQVAQCCVDERRIRRVQPAAGHVAPDGRDDAQLGIPHVSHFHLAVLRREI